MQNLIKNRDSLETTANRKLVLDIAEAGLESINTANAILRDVSLSGDTLSIKGKDFDLSKFKKIKVVGFGKASVGAAIALEKILGQRITVGAVVGLHKVALSRIETFAGTHPKPTQANVDAGDRIFEIIKDSTSEDLIITLVSGGGSALLCYSKTECDQDVALYDNFLKGGGTIEEINTVRKHLSILKGGGLAKVAYPATVVGLIFSDIPGGNFADVASGPTYKDESTTKDAQAVIEKYHLGNFELLETPKEDVFFENVHNFVLVSNKTAIEAMVKKSAELHLKSEVVSTEMYDEVSLSLKKIFNAKATNTVVLAAGEPMLEIKRQGGDGGRNLYMSLRAIQMGLVDEHSVFLPFASDGMDNSDVAGAIVDKFTLEKMAQRGIDVNDYLERFDAYSAFKKSGDMVVTGPTGANVSDLMILLTKN